ncbi:hypothetical protein [Caballeronia sp. LZ019]|uniref:hypothetical protein n=1 Tax=Caballeronia sp. LZ019 TaxID=3038555 RepID=UPI00286755E4|nr:hypothetical protein [Caballeronia sp. LZ019]MDR5811508.1 hypothetical protein [Caballeronia sp. LZ019]
MTFFLRDPNAVLAGSTDAAPTVIGDHTGNPQYIGRAPDGRFVTLNADGVPLRDDQGRMEVWRDPATYSPEQMRAIWRGTDPHVTHIQASMDEGAAARAELIKRGLING